MPARKNTAILHNSRCIICKHISRLEIDQALLRPDNTPGKVQKMFPDTKAISLRRHRDKCLAKEIVQIMENVEKRGMVTVEKVSQNVSERRLETSLNIERELTRCFERMNKLFDACDEWLEDPERPGTYSVAPRASEVALIWEELAEDGKWIKKSGTIQDALDLAFTNGHKRPGQHSVPKRDMRELIIKTSSELGRQIDLLARLEGRFRPDAPIDPLSQGGGIQLQLVIQILQEFYPDVR